MIEVIDCPYEENDDLLRQYVAGTVADAEEFEGHLFACERCRQEVEQGLTIRAALLQPAGASLLRWRFPSVTFAAAAAALILVAIGLWQMRSTETAVMQPVRGTERGELTASARLANGALVVSWRANPAARQYVIQLFTPEGTLLQSVRTSETTATVPLASGRGSSLYWKVQALDENGTVIGSSELRRIAVSR